MSDLKLVKLDLSSLTTVSEVIESELLANGIQVVRVEVGGHSVYPTAPMAWVDLYVPEESLADALVLLEKIARLEQIPEEQNPDGSVKDDGGSEVSQG